MGQQPVERRRWVSGIPSQWCRCGARLGFSKYCDRPECREGDDAWLFKQIVDTEVESALTPSRNKRSLGSRLRKQSAAPDESPKS